MAIALTVSSLGFDSERLSFTEEFDKDEILIGRADDCTLILDTPDCEDHQALLYIDKKADFPCFRLKNLSKNAASVRVSHCDTEPGVEAIIRPNQRIIVGNFLIIPVILEDEIVRLKEAIKPTRDEDNSVWQATSDIPQKSLEAIGDGGSLDFSTTITVTAPGEEALRVDFVAKALCPIIGKALHNGKPLEGVSVYGQLLGETSTDAEGMFAFPAQIEGTKYQIFLSHPKYKFEPESIEGIVSPYMNLDFLGKKLVSLKGTITYGGKGLEGVLIYGGDLGEVFTNEKGQFQFDDLPESSEFTLVPSKAGYCFEPAEYVGVTASEDVAVSIISKKLTSVVGKVTHAGKPLAGVLVNAGKFGDTVTNESGEYRFENVPEGTSLTLRLMKDGYRLSKHREEERLADLESESEYIQPHKNGHPVNGVFGSHGSF